MLLELLNQDGIEPKKTGSEHFNSPCPECGGNDRFIIWTDSDRYHCNQCRKNGDAIQYLRDFHGMNFQDAAAAVGRPELLSLNGRKQGAVKNDDKREKTQKRHPAEWRKNAKRIIEATNLNLFSRNGTLNWLLTERGITATTAERFNLGWLSQNQKTGGVFIPSGLVIPWQDKRIRVRRDNPGNYPKYHIVKGSDMEPMTIGAAYENTAIIVESELDAILLAQEIERPLFIVALGSAQRNPDKSLIDRLNQSPVVLIALDNDDPGAKSAVKWLVDYKNTYRALTPKKYGKDPTEAFVNGLDLNLWLHFSLEIVADYITNQTR